MVHVVANGVILITTKRGKSGEARVTFDAKWGINKRGVPNYETITDPATFYELNYSSIYNADLKGYAAAGDLAKANAYANQAMLLLHIWDIRCIPFLKDSN